jgi:hypothetical protein
MKRTLTEIQHENELVARTSQEIEDTYVHLRYEQKQKESKFSPSQMVLQVGPSLHDASL